MNSGQVLSLIIGFAGGSFFTNLYKDWQNRGKVKMRDRKLVVYFRLLESTNTFQQINVTFYFFNSSGHDKAVESMQAFMMVHNEFREMIFENHKLNPSIMIPAKQIKEYGYNLSFAKKQNTFQSADLLSLSFELRYKINGKAFTEIFTNNHIEKKPAMIPINPV